MAATNHERAAKSLQSLQPTGSRPSKCVGYWLAVAPDQAYPLAVT